MNARGLVDASGANEAHFLEPLDAVAASGVTPAEAKVALYEGDWGRDVSPIWDAFAY